MLDLKQSYFRANDYSNPQYIGSKFRKKRFEFFESKIKAIQRPITIVDIGGTVRFWTDENYHHKNVFITVVNLQSQESTYSNIRVIRGNACNLSFFKDQAFDVAFSNSLIEHLYTKENQRKMANEAMRIGRNFFIQTPNRYFPIEPHFKFPFFQFLPKSVQVFLQTKTSLINGVRYGDAYAKEIVDEIKLLSKKEMMHFFPNSHIHVEYFLGLEKSFTAHNFPKN